MLRLLQRQLSSYFLIAVVTSIASVITCKLSTSMITLAPTRTDDDQIGMFHTFRESGRYRLTRRIVRGNLEISFIRCL